MFRDKTSNSNEFEDSRGIAEQETFVERDGEFGDGPTEPRVEPMVVEDNSTIPSLLLLTGVRTGKLLPIESGKLTLGRRRGDVDIWFQDRRVSRRHAKIVRTSTGLFSVHDVDSSAGTFVNGDPVSDGHVLKGGDKLSLSRNAILKFMYADAVERSFYERMYHSAVRDRLTGAYSREYLVSLLKSEAARVDREGRQPYPALVFLDVDHFKEVNDRLNHAAGDSILSELVERLSTITRTSDVIGRYGGDEFGVLLRGVPTSEVLDICSRLRRAVSDQPFTFRGTSIDITISVGVAFYAPDRMEGAADWFQAVDNGLYRAKQKGRDCVRFAFVPEVSDAVAAE